MALNSSGPISLGGTTAGQSIALENGGTGTSTISLNDAAVRGLAGVSSGAIIMPTNFYGKSNATYMIANWGQMCMTALDVDSSNNIYACGNYIFGNLAGYARVTAAGSNTATRWLSGGGFSSPVYWLGVKTNTTVFLGAVAGGATITASTLTKTATYDLNYNSGGSVPPSNYPFNFSGYTTGPGVQLPSGNFVITGGSTYSFCCSAYSAPNWRLFNTSWGVVNGAGTNQSSNAAYSVGSDVNSNFYVGILQDSGSGTYWPQFYKYNSSGTYQGQVGINAGNSYDASAATADSSGNIYVGASGSYVSFFCKYNSSFAVQYKYVFNGADDRNNYKNFSLRNITTDSSGNVYVAGNCASTSVTQARIVVFKFNSAGTTQWVREWISNSYQYATFDRNQAAFRVMPNGAICFAFRQAASSTSGGGFVVLPADGSKTGTYSTTSSGTYTWQANTTVVLSTTTIGTTSLGNLLSYAFTRPVNARSNTENTATNGDVNII